MYRRIARSFQTSASSSHCLLRNPEFLSAAPIEHQSPRSYYESRSDTTHLLRPRRGPMIPQSSRSWRIATRLASATQQLPPPCVVTIADSRRGPPAQCPSTAARVAMYNVWARSTNNLPSPFLGLLGRAHVLCILCQLLLQHWSCAIACSCLGRI